MPISLLCAAALLPAVAHPQQMDYHARLQMKAEVARLADPLAAPTLGADAGVVMSALGLTWTKPAAIADPTVAFSPTAGAVLELVDIRLLLTQIAIQTGARDHVALVRAQGDRDHDVILLRGGFVQLADLLSLSQGTAAQDFVKIEAGALVLTRPLAIWSDAGLMLGPDDHLVLDRPSGSFVANLGRLDVTGGKIAGSIAENTTEPAFRPFVITAGLGSFTAKDATFQSLGFGNATVFGGLAVANNGLVPSRMASALMGSTLYDVGTVGLIGTTGAVVSGNWIAASGGAAVLIADSRGASIAANRLTTLFGTQAIRVTAGSEMVRIDGNLISGGARTGILIDRESHDIVVSNNLVSGSAATGISVDAATCVMLVGNLVASNGGAGINLSDTDGVTATDNAILFNRGSGVMVRDQAQTALVGLSGNVFVGNRDGLRGATPGNLVLADNKFDGQIPRMFAGDLSRLTADWLRDPDAAVPVSTGAAQASSTASCAIAGEG